MKHGRKTFFVITLLFVAFLAARESQSQSEDIMNQESLGVTTSFENEILSSSLLPQERTSLLGATAVNPALPQMNAFLSPVSGRLNEEPGEQEEGLLGLKAELYLISDLEAKAHYLEKQAERRWPLASLTKLMTAVVAEEIATSTSITIESQDFSSLDTSTYHAISSGEVYNAYDLIRLMLVSSSNEAAHALARTYGMERFLARMNALALEWGMSNTYFDDPAGLTSSNQSTLLDLEVLMGRLSRDYPDLLRLTRASSVSIKEETTGRLVKTKATHPFAGTASFLGGKTGYTEDARGNLISLFSLNQRPILVIVLGSDVRDQDTSLLLNWIKER